MNINWSKVEELIKTSGTTQEKLSEKLNKHKGWLSGIKNREGDLAEDDLLKLAYYLDCRIEDIQLTSKELLASPKDFVNINNNISEGFNAILADLESLKSEVVGMDSRLYNMSAALGTICDYVDEQCQLKGLAKRVIKEALMSNGKIHDKDMSTLKNLLSVTEVHFSLIKNELGLVATNVKEGHQDKTEKYWKLETGYKL